MSDARIAFDALRERAGDEYDTATMHAHLDEVEHRVGRARLGRHVMTFAAVGVAAFVVGALAMQFTRATPVEPVETPSATPSSSSSTSTLADFLAMPCTVATIVPGNPIEQAGGGILSGFEGWFNSTLAEPGGCDSSDNWSSDTWLMASHPDTVWINTSDNTVIEAYFRTSRDALGVWGHMDGKKIADPEPTWPPDSAVLIDARTGEVLTSQRLDEMVDIDVGSSSSATEGTVEP